MKAIKQTKHAFPSMLELLPTRSVVVGTFLAEPLVVVHTGWLATPDFPVGNVVRETVVDRRDIHWRAN